MPPLLLFAITPMLISFADFRITPILFSLPAYADFQLQSQPSRRLTPSSPLRQYTAFQMTADSLRHSRRLSILIFC
jgi:hypothetical protein